MDKKIYKYKLNPDSDTELRLPVGSKFISANSQISQNSFKDGNLVEELFVWYIIPTYENISFSKRMIKIIPTGQEFKDDGLTFLQTVHLKSAQLVFHIFEYSQ